MNKQVILTGLRANNDLHIGNYFGALLPLIDMAAKRSGEYQVNLFVPDLHSFTTPIDHTQLHDQILHNLRIFIAAGLPINNPNVHIYRQSYISAHSELTWILDCFTGFGEMGRMTQFKEKSKLSPEERLNIYRSIKQIESDFTNQGIDIQDAQSWRETSLEAVIDQRRATTSLGLFNYPVLMAADILLYDAKYIPVGDDQTQHLEFTRDIAERMNAKFNKELFTVPEPVSRQHEFFGNGTEQRGLRIKDLSDPTKKMSKSDETGKGVIFLGDSPEVASKKIRSATTDSYGKVDVDNQVQPGIENLMRILSLSARVPYEEVKATYEGQEQYGPLKNDTATAIAEFLASFQKRLLEVDEQAMMKKLKQDEAEMNRIANQTLLRVQKAVGLRK